MPNPVMFAQTRQGITEAISLSIFIIAFIITLFYCSGKTISVYYSKENEKMQRKIAEQFFRRLEDWRIRRFKAKRMWISGQIRNDKLSSEQTKKEQKKNLLLFLYSKSDIRNDKLHQR